MEASWSLTHSLELTHFRIKQSYCHDVAVINPELSTFSHMRFSWHFPLTFGFFRRLDVLNRP